MELYIIIQISIYSSIFGWVYVHELTQNRQILDFLKGYYHYLPDVLAKVLSCEKCLGGWIAFICYLVYMFQLDSISIILGINLIFAPILSIFVSLLIKRILR